MIVLDNIKLSQVGPPRDISGYAIVGLEDPAAVLQDVAKFAGKSVKADGKFHKVSLGMFSQFLATVRVAAKKEALVVTAGDRSKSTVEKVLKQQPGKSPLLLIAEDVGKMARFSSSFMSMSGGAMGVDMSFMEEMSTAQEKLFGLAVFSIYADDRGVVMTGRIDIK